MAKTVGLSAHGVGVADWSALNGPYREFLGSSLPARTAFAASALPLGARVEIEDWAVVEESR
jgi:enamine deaminase RidA (YjgF/YER057c/UK114 family)